MLRTLRRLDRGTIEMNLGGSSLWGHLGTWDCWSPRAQYSRTPTVGTSEQKTATGMRTEGRG
eukprot:1059699-Pyramimonas_sp.AAC.1